jgi:hypothetical protein
MTFFHAKKLSDNLAKNGVRYDHNFLSFLPIFAENLAIFFKIQCYDQNFLNASSIEQKNANIFTELWAKNIF